MLNKLRSGLWKA